MREFSPTPGWRQAAVFIRLLAESLGVRAPRGNRLKRLVNGKRRCIIINDGKGFWGPKMGLCQHVHVRGRKWILLSWAKVSSANGRISQSLHNRL